MKRWKVVFRTTRGLYGSRYCWTKGGADREARKLQTQGITATVARA